MGTLLAQIFSSSAKFQILEVLHDQSEALSLRMLTELAQLNVRSGELSLNSLAKLKIVQEKRDSNERLFKLNPHHETYKIIKSFMRGLKKEKLKKRALKLSLSASQALDFSLSFHKTFST